MRSAHAWASGRNSLLSLSSPVTQLLPVDADNPLRAAPSYPRGPACTTARGLPGIYHPAPPPPYPCPLHAPPAAHKGSLLADVPRLLPAGAVIWAAPAPPATLAALGCAAPGPMRPGVGLPAGPSCGPRQPHQEFPAPSGGGAEGAPGATGPCPLSGRRGDAGAAGSTGAGGGAPGGTSCTGAYRGGTAAPGDNQPPVLLLPTGPTRLSTRPQPCKPRQRWLHGVTPALPLPGALLQAPIRGAFLRTPSPRN